MHFLYRIKDEGNATEHYADIKLATKKKTYVSNEEMVDNDLYGT